MEEMGSKSGEIMPKEYDKRTLYDQGTVDAFVEVILDPKSDCTLGQLAVVSGVFEVTCPEMKRIWEIVNQPEVSIVTVPIDLMKQVETPPVFKDPDGILSSFPPFLRA